MPVCNEGDKEKTLNPSKVRSMTLKDVYGRFVGQPVLVSSDENAVFFSGLYFGVEKLNDVFTDKYASSKHLNKSI